MVTDAVTFHTQLRQAEADRPASAASTHLLIGVRQPTPTTARITANQLVALDTYRGDDLAGDGTVPVTGATPAGVPLDSNTLRRVADKHGNLQRNKAAFDEIESVLTSQPIIVRATPTIEPRVDIPELVLAGQPVPIDVTLPGGERHGIRITVLNERGTPVESRTPRPTKGHTHAILTGLPPGGYTVTVSGISPASPIAPVSSELLIWEDAQIE